MTNKYRGELCSGKAKTIITETNEGFTFWNTRPSKPTKRIRMKCELCGRRVWSSVMIDHDGHEIFHTIPPHKPKGWWKKRNKK